MTSIVNLTPTDATFSRKIKDLMHRIQAGGLYWHIIIPDEAHQERMIPPDLTFGIIPSKIPPQDALDAAIELRDIWWKDAGVRLKMTRWYAERGMVFQKLKMAYPSTWRGGGAA